MMKQPKVIASAGSLLVKASVLRNLSMIVTIVTSFITLPILIKLLGDETYGIWVIIGALMGYFGVLDFGLSSAVIRFLSLHWKERLPQKIGEVLITSLVGLSIFSVVVFFIVLAVMWCAPLFLSNPEMTGTVRVVLLIMGLDLVFGFVMTIFRSVLITQLRFDILSLLQISHSIVRLGCVFVILAYEGGILEVALMTFILNIFVRCAHAYYAIATLPEGTLKRQFFNKVALFEYFNFGKFSFLGQVADIVRFRIDVMVIGGLMSSSLVVPYNVALQLQNAAGQTVGNVISGTQPIFTNYFGQNRLDLMREKLLLLTRVSVCVSVMAASSVILIANPFIIFWVGESYLTAVPPLIVLCLLFPLGIGQNAAVQIFYAASKHHQYAYANMAEAAFNLLLSLWLVQYFGIFGVALGTAIPFVICKTCFLPYAASKIVELPTSQYLFNFFRVLVLVVIPELVCWLLLSRLGINELLETFIFVSAWQLLVAIYVLRFVLKKEDEAYIFDYVPFSRRIFGK